ncbi:unnamed protein product [Amaranthus hypochondriacus]
MNCAHLENCLHETKQEAQTHLCAANRRASEYNKLRASAVKMRGLFGRLKSCVNPSGGVTGFSDALCSLAQSLSSYASDGEDDGTTEFRACIRGLADRVAVLLRHQLDRCAKAEAATKQLLTDSEERKELIKTLYTKHQLEKQANKEKISFCRFEVHKIAAFILNSSGHYEAISRNCPNYFLSPESVALFTVHLPSRPAYIIGQIVHIERHVVKPRAGAQRPERITGGDQTNCSTSSYDTLANCLPVGCEYFVVTVAMLPDTTIHSPQSS